MIEDHTFQKTSKREVFYVRKAMNFSNLSVSSPILSSIMKYLLLLCKAPQKEELMRTILEEWKSKR